MTDYSYDTHVKLHFYEDRLLGILGNVFGSKIWLGNISLLSMDVNEL